MRIISGQFGGRRFQPPAKMPARPTTDRAKEGLFNILQNMVSFPHLKTLDLFGGTGNISYELASRGVTDLTIVERSRKMVDFITQNFAKLDYLDQVRIVGDDVFKFMGYDENKYDFIFAGPPYALDKIDKIPQIILDKSLLTIEGIFILEHTPRNDYQGFPGFFRVVNYGTTLFSFFRLPST